MGAKVDVVSVIICESAQLDPIGRYDLRGVFSNTMLVPPGRFVIPLQLVLELVPTESGEFGLFVRFSYGKQKLQTVRLGGTATEAKESVLVATPLLTLRSEEAADFRIEASHDIDDQDAWKLLKVWPLRFANIALLHAQRRTLLSAEPPTQSKN